MSDRHKLPLQHTCTFVYFRQLLHHSISALLSLFASFRDYILGEMTFWMGIPSQRSVDTRIWTRRKYGNNAVTNGKSKCHIKWYTTNPDEIQIKIVQDSKEKGNREAGEETKMKVDSELVGHGIHQKLLFTKSSFIVVVDEMDMLWYHDTKSYLI